MVEKDLDFNFYPYLQEEINEDDQMSQEKEQLDPELKVDERNLDDSDIEEDKSEQVQMEDDNDFDADFDDFGDFTNFEEAAETEVDENLSKEPKEPVPFVPPLNLDEDNDDDDDFGDFEEPEAFSEAKNNEKFEASFASSSGWASLDSSPRGQIDQILIGVNYFLLLFI